LGLKFAQASRFVLQVGLKNFASYGTDGVEVANPAYPFRLVFVPKVSTPAEIPGFFDPDRPEDFTDALVKALMDPSQQIFDIYAHAEPESQGVLIGKLLARSEAVKSRFGDAHIMFGHWDFAEDVEDHPDWEEKVPTFSAWNIFKNFYTEETPGYETPSVGCPLGY
jgi:hypothetical protein